MFRWPKAQGSSTCLLLLRRYLEHSSFAMGRLMTPKARSTTYASSFISPALGSELLKTSSAIARRNHPCLEGPMKFDSPTGVLYRRRHSFGKSSWNLIILDNSGRVMDGMHRVCKALLQGIDTVAAVQFDGLT